VTGERELDYVKLSVFVLSFRAPLSGVSGWKTSILCRDNYLCRPT